MVCTLRERLIKAVSQNVVRCPIRALVIVMHYIEEAFWDAALVDSTAYPVPVLSL